MEILFVKVERYMLRIGSRQLPYQGSSPSGETKHRND